MMIKIRSFFNKQNRSKSKKQKGQSLVELTLTITILLTLLAGAFDFGSAFFDFIALRDAAQEGAVYGSIDPAAENILQRIQASSTSPLNMSDFSGDCNPINGVCINFFDSAGDIPASPCSGDTVTVTVNYQYNLTMPFIGAIIGSQTIPLHATVTNVILSPMCEEGD